jgi:hypothetical protein
MLSSAKQKDSLDKHSNSGSIFRVEQTNTGLRAFVDNPKVAQALSDSFNTKPEVKYLSDRKNIWQLLNLSHLTPRKQTLLVQTRRCFKQNALELQEVSSGFLWIN